MILEKGYANEQNPVRYWPAHRMPRRCSFADECDRVGSRCGNWNFGDRFDRRIGQVEYKKNALKQPHPR